MRRSRSAPGESRGREWTDLHVAPPHPVFGGRKCKNNISAAAAAAKSNYIKNVLRESGIYIFGVLILIPRGGCGGDRAEPVAAGADSRSGYKGRSSAVLDEGVRAIYNSERARSLYVYFCIISYTRKRSTIRRRGGAEFSARRRRRRDVKSVPRGGNARRNGSECVLRSG